jgi:predicted RNase H-like HicB family nuclease
MFDWEFVLLQIIAEMGGEACLPDISASVKKSVGPNSGTSPKRVPYDRTLRNHLSRLCEKEHLVKLPRGCYGMTFQGQQKLLNDLAYRDPKSPLLKKERARTNLVFPVDIERLAEGGYLATCSSMQGCHAEGDTVAEALANLEDAAVVLMRFHKAQERQPPAGLEEFQPGQVIKAQLVLPLPG